MYIRMWVFRWIIEVGVGGLLVLLGSFRIVDVWVLVSGFDFIDGKRFGY